MNKLFKCLSTAVLGIAMAVGVGVGVASSKGVEEVKAETTSVEFIKYNSTDSKYDYDSDVATIGNSTNIVKQTKYCLIHSSNTLTTNSTYNVDTSKDITIKLAARKFGTVTGGKEVMTFNVLDSTSGDVVGSGTLKPTNTTPTTQYSGTIQALKIGVNKALKFQIAAASNSSSGAGCGMTSASFSFTNGSSQETKQATGMNFDKSNVEVYAGDEASFTPTLTGGSGDFETTIRWESNNNLVIPNPDESEDGETVTVVPNKVESITEVTLKGTVISPGSASNSIKVIVKPAKTIHHYSVTGTATGNIGSSWDLSALFLHGWFDAEETDEKVLVKGVDYELTTLTPVGDIPTTKDITVSDSMELIPGYWVVKGTVKEPPVETTVTIDTSNTNQVTENSSELVTFEEGIVSFSISKSNSSTPANNYLGQGNNGTRLYAKSSVEIKIEGENKNLTKVVFSKTVNNTNAVKNIGTTDWIGGTAESVGTDVVVTANNAIQTITHTVAGKCDIGSVKITYEAPYQAVTGIDLDKQSITMTSYDEDRIIAKSLPTDATVGGVTFEGYDEEIISVDENGYILPTGTKFGLTEVTIKSKGNKSDGTKATAKCTITIVRAPFKEAKYTYASSSEVVPSGDIITGSQAVYDSEGTKFGVTDHIETGTITLTISGMAGYKVQSVVMKMKSHADSGSASFTLKVGNTTLKSISAKPFSDSEWYGSYTSDNVLMRIDMDNADYKIQNGENVVLTFKSTVAGFYMTDYRIRYTEAGLPADAVAFAQKLLTELTCDGTGNNAPSTTTWNNLKDYYLDDQKMTAKGRQILFESAASGHDYDPTIDKSEAEIIAAAMYRYDYVVGKYHSTVYADFINRNPAPIGQNNMLSSMVESNNNVIIVIVISVISLSILGGYFFIRRRKETH